MSIKRAVLVSLSILASCAIKPAFAQPTYCNIESLTYTATARSGSYDNSRNQCWAWEMTYYSTGTVSVELDGSNDGGSTWTAIPAATGSTCTNPATSAACNVTTATYYKAISINITITGAGSVTARADGTAGITAKLPNASGGGGGITALNGDGTAGPGSGAQALTLSAVNSSPGVCGDSTHVCKVTTNGKGLVTAQSAVAISGGGGGVANVVGLALITVSGSTATCQVCSGVITGVTRNAGGGNPTYTLSLSGLANGNYAVFGSNNNAGGQIGLFTLGGLGASAAPPYSTSSFTYAFCQPSTNCGAYLDQNVQQLIIVD